MGIPVAVRKCSCLFPEREMRMMYCPLCGEPTLGSADNVSRKSTPQASVDACGVHCGEWGILWIFRLFSRMCPHPESIPLSAHIGGESLIDERLQSLRLVLFRDGSYDGVAYDVAAAVNHIGGGISKDVGSKLSRLTI